MNEGKRARKEGRKEGTNERREDGPRALVFYFLAVLPFSWTLPLFLVHVPGLKRAYVLDPCKMSVPGKKNGDPQQRFHCLVPGQRKKRIKKKDKNKHFFLLSFSFPPSSKNSPRQCCALYFLDSGMPCFPRSAMDFLYRDLTGYLRLLSRLTIN